MSLKNLLYPFISKSRASYCWC